MKLPSVDYLYQKTKSSFLRFPLTILSAFIAVIIAIYLTEYNKEINNTFPYINSMLTAALGIPLFFCVTIFNKKFGYPLVIQLLINLLAVLVLVGVFFSLPDSELTNNSSLPYIRYTIFNITFHLLVSYVPYLKNRNLNGFWNYNKTLFIRFWTSVLYSSFLYAGISTAIGSLYLLFDFDLSEEVFFYVFIIIIGLFNTWFFVSGIPKDLDQLEEVRTYPKGLKIFSQYILIPILIIYLIILYSYTTKILVTWNWPRGIVSYLIAIISTLGILTILLVYPYSLSKENNWINKFSRVYYFFLIPLIVVLFFAIGFRIGDYGITINRYIIVLLGVWLSLVSLYFSFQKKNIKFIPISLSIILLLMSFGPWSMFSISEKSQSKRLISILKEHDLIMDNKIQNESIWELSTFPEFKSNNLKSNDGILNDSLNNEVKSILDYLDNHHGFSSISHLFSQNIDSLIKLSLDINKYVNDAEIYMKSLGLAYTHRYNNNSITLPTSSFYRITSNAVKNVSGYNYYLSFNHSNYGNDNENKILSLEIDSVALKLEISNRNRSIKVIEDSDTIYFDINQVINPIQANYGKKGIENIASNEMVLLNKSNDFDYKIQLSSFRLYEDNKDSSKLVNLNGYLLFNK